MAAARSSSSSQMDSAPRVTIRAPSSTPNTGAAGLTEPAPSPARALPASLMNFWASALALAPRAALIQSLMLISIWAMAGPTADRMAARGRNTKAERMACMPSARTIDWATETSRIGRAMTTARASMTRYWEANQSALTTSGLVVPWIRAPTFSRKNLPAAATAAVKLRRALSPAVETTFWAAPATALVTAWPGLVPARQTLRATGLGMASQRSWVGSAGWLWAMAAGASTTSRAARAARTRTVRAQARLRSWCIGELLELIGLVDQLGGGGRGGDVGDRDRPVGGRALGQLPVVADPAQLDRGGAPALADRGCHGPADRPADAGHPDGHLGLFVAVVLDPPADRGGPQQHLGAVAGGVADAEALAERDHRLVEGPLEAGLGRWGGQGGDRRPAPGGVEDEVAGQHPGEVGRRGHGALLAVVVADPDPGLEPARPDLGRGRRLGRGRGGRARGGGHGRGRGLGGRRGGGRGGGPAVLAAAGHGGPADDHAAKEQHHRQQHHGHQRRHAAGPEAPLLGEAVQDPGPLVAHGHDPQTSANAGQVRRTRRARGVGGLAMVSLGGLTERERPVHQGGGRADDDGPDHRVQGGPLAHRGLVVVGRQRADAPHGPADDDADQGEQQGEGADPVDQLLDGAGTGDGAEVRGESDILRDDDHAQQHR